MADGVLHYSYRGGAGEEEHRDNRGLRAAHLLGLPLIYLFGIAKGEYLASWPVYVVGDDRGVRQFRISIDDAEAAPSISATGPVEKVDAAGEQRRAYVTTTVLRRLHQRSFRQRVLRAYQERCAVCRLRHRVLLEAAHILPYKHPMGDPNVENGIALCTLHHAAFDHNVIGIRPDYVIELREDVLEEEDGPMLEHGLQGFDGETIGLPRAKSDRPNAAFLEERYELFRRQA